ncbi:MAG: archease [Spirochaetes bacterium]|nr:archease [Spirochaetota bacterium]
MYNIEYLEHTADIGFKIIADSMQELFRGSILEMFNNLISIKSDKKKKARSFTVKGADSNELLYNILKNFLDNFYLKRFVPVSILSIRIENGKVKIKTDVVSAGKEDSRNYKLLREIKAVTYHKLDIQEEDGKFETILIFDV